MGTVILDNVLSALRSAGLRADLAYPGEKMPQLTGPVAAVSLEAVEYALHKLTVLVTVLCPAGSGGSSCQSAAVSAANALTQIGGTCTQEACAFHQIWDAYYVRVLAEFSGADADASWKTVPGFSAKIGSTPLPNAVSFTAKQVLDTESGIALSASPWQFILEEQFPPGTSEILSLAEPFLLTIARNTGSETYQECTWTSVTRMDSSEGLHQIRTGVATGRTSIDIL